MDVDKTSRKRAGESEGELEQDLRQATKSQTIEDNGQPRPVEGENGSVVDAILSNDYAAAQSSGSPQSPPRQPSVILLPPPPTAGELTYSGEASDLPIDSGAADAIREPNPGGPEGMAYPKPGEGPGSVSRENPVEKGRSRLRPPHHVSEGVLEVEPDHQVGASRSHSQPLSSRRATPYSYRKADWDSRLLSEYEEYCQAPRGVRKGLWQEWTKEERQRVYVYSRKAFKEEQKRWKEEEEERGLPLLDRVSREQLRAPEDSGSQAESHSQGRALLYSQVSGAAPPQRVASPESGWQRDLTQDGDVESNPGPLPAQRGTGSYGEFPGGQGWSFQQLQSLTAAATSFGRWRHKRRKPGFKPRDQHSQASRTSPEKRVLPVHKTTQEDGVGPARPRHGSNPRIPPGTQNDGYNLNKRCPQRLYARDQSRTATSRPPSRPPPPNSWCPPRYSDVVRGNNRNPTQPQFQSQPYRRREFTYEPFSVHIQNDAFNPTQPSHFRGVYSHPTSTYAGQQPQPHRQQQMQGGHPLHPAHRAHPRSAARPRAAFPSTGTSAALRAVAGAGRASAARATFPRAHRPTHGVHRMGMQNDTHKTGPVS